MRAPPSASDNGKGSQEGGSAWNFLHYEEAFSRAQTETVPDESHPPSPPMATDVSALEHDPVDSFSFLTRFTTNDSGMEGAFDIDSRLAMSVHSDVDSPEANMPELQSSIDTDPQVMLFEQHLEQGTLQDGQNFSESYDWDEVPRSMDFSDASWMTEPHLEVFFTSQWINTSPVFSAPSDVLEHEISKPQDSLSCSSSAKAAHSSFYIRSHEILVGIKQTVTSRRSSPVSNIVCWSKFLETACSEFFGPENLLRFLSYYWALWYPNWPTIHRPSCDPASIPFRLLASMALIGASLSTQTTDRESAKLWFDIVEEMVFSDESAYNLSEATCVKCPPEHLEDRLRSLQASYAVCLYQNWEGQHPARGRVRRQRYPMVISLARDLIRYANHPLDDLDMQNFDWKTFVVREELIRTVMYVFLLDIAFTIFNNLPPRMVVREMTIDLVCPEPCFQAETAEDCYTKIKSWISHPLWSKQATLYAAIRHFRQPKIAPDVQHYLARSGILNLWAIASAFHSFLFHIDPGFGSDSQCLTMRNAIANWRVVWNLQFMSKSQDFDGIHDPTAMPSAGKTKAPWKRIGFMRNAPEYWLLARIILERLESTQRSLEAAESLSGHANWRCNMPVSMLSKYDETSMEQLNEFITSFEALRVNEQEAG